MTAFEFLSVALSFVLGLAATLVLTSLLTAFRVRRDCRLDWLPFLWTGYVLLYQLQYWWAVFELSEVSEWTVGMFAVLLLMAGLLFLAGGLVLPSGVTEYPSDLGAYFRADGRWALVAVAAYALTSTGANAVLFGSTFVNPLNGISVGAALAAVGTAVAQRRALQVGLSLLFGILLVVGFVQATPVAY